MPSFLNKFSFEAIKFDGVIAVCLVLIWAVVIATVVSSILGQPFSKKQRIFWMLMVICLPVLGLLFYLPFSIKHDEYPLLFNWRSKK